MERIAAVSFASFGDGSGDGDGPQLLRPWLDESHDGGGFGDGGFGFADSLGNGEGEEFVDGLGDDFGLGSGDYYLGSGDYGFGLDDYSLSDGSGYGHGLPDEPFEWYLLFLANAETED